MSKLQKHSFETASMEALVSEHAQDIQVWSGWLKDGKGDAQAICRNVVGFSIWNGCANLVLGRGEAEALRDFRQGIRYGLMGLAASGSKRALRAYDVVMDIAADGSPIVHEHEPRLSREPPKVSSSDYRSVLELAVCFGSRGEMEEVARYPEDRYRNPNLVASEDFYGYLRAWKHLLLGEEVRARTEMQNALTESSNEESQRDMEAFASLMERDEQRFRMRVEERLSAHGERYKKRPTDPEGIVCFPVLMLCRVAIDRGGVLEEWPYVPLKLLPNAAARNSERPPE